MSSIKQKTVWLYTTKTVITTLLRISDSGIIMIDMKVFTSKTQKIGEFGESLAVRWLKEQGYSVIDRNWTCPLGEIDIIATKDNMVHFIEVKSVQMRLPAREGEGYNPADNITRGKLQKIIVTCMEYLHKVGLGGLSEWQMDVLLVRFDTISKQAQIQMLESVTRD